MKYLITTSGLILALAAASLAGDRPARPEADALLGSLAENVSEEWIRGIEEWGDEELQAELAGKSWTEEEIRTLYAEFRERLIPPPDPDAIDYVIDPEAVGAAEARGRRMYNILLAMSDGDAELYGPVIGGMTSVLYLDFTHGSLVAQGSRSRDVFWAELRTRWISKTVLAYDRSVK